MSSVTWMQSLSQEMGLLVVHQTDPLQQSKELIIVLHSVLDGLVTALHICLDHQMLMTMKCQFCTLDLSQAINHVCYSSHMCHCRSFPPNTLSNHPSCPSNIVGSNFAANVIKWNCQLILMLWELVTAYTAASIIADESYNTLCDSLLQLCMELHSLDGLNATVRIDPAPGLMAILNDQTLKDMKWNFF